MPEARYDDTFYPHGSRFIHRTATYELSGASKTDSTVTSKCGKTYTVWKWAEHVDKPMCPKCGA